MTPLRSLWLWSGLFAALVSDSGSTSSTQGARVGLAFGSAALAEHYPAPPGESQHVEVVKVGLLVPGEDEALAAKQGAEMAVAKANEGGGFGGRPFELIVRRVEGPWGSGSKAIVNLVFEEGVWAILGALDGRGAHLAEQVVTKGRVVLVSSWATDPTLSQINIPWFFRPVPDDRQQARALVSEIFQARRLQRVATVAADGYDARVAATTFAQVAREAGYPLSVQLSYGEAGRDFEVVLSRIENHGVEGVVLFGPPSPAAELIRRMRARGMRQALFGPLSIVDCDFLESVGTDLEGAVLVAPGHWRARGKTFRQEFQDTYGYLPNAVAAYAYDGMRVIVQAIEQVGLDRERIRDAVANIHYMQGVTGPIRFDAKGNRLGPVGLVEIINGRPSFLDGA